MMERLLQLLTAAVVLAATQASGAADYRISFQPRAFLDCNDAASYLAAHPVVAHMSYQVHLTTSRPRLVRLRSQSYRADTVLHLRIDPSSAILSMPQWSWRDMSAQQQAGLRAYMNALQQHEVGHLRIAQRYVAGGATTLHIFGPDAATLAKRLRLSVRRYGQEMSVQLQRRQQLYDRVTQHGAKQVEASNYGLPTGADVEFRCP
ncbi:MAG: DUF922 domain-containing protein [Candidatus Eremiobacteraeota bacterium]|nr:DUF922 domain-containing protein [Candidatus Eremiobacteraeota bacterium]